MNIFVMDQNPRFAAELLFSVDFRRANKQLLECCQCIAACGITLPKSDGISFYKVTHKHHPIVKWMAKDTMHLLWVIDFSMALALEYNKITGKTHGCTAAVLAAAEKFKHRGRMAVSHIYVSRIDFPALTDVYSKYKALLEYKNGRG